MAQDNHTQILMAVNEATQRELAAILDGDFSFYAAGSADEASSLLRKNSYQAAIVDEDLPDHGCHAILESLRQQGAEFPVLICTGEVGDKGTFAESKHDDTFVSDVLIRPFSRTVVRSRIESALHAGEGAEHVGATLPSHPLE